MNSHSIHAQTYVEPLVATVLKDGTLYRALFGVPLSPTYPYMLEYIPLN